MDQISESQWRFFKTPKIFLQLLDTQQRTETRIKIHPTSVPNLRAAPAIVEAVKLT